eukprot:CAMPEP_0204621938 /NCGR_PEP_ID=MMETSP0717-20131115/7595_1 /ASSEMBLY_ACC=CAM_ASM_000666 /TAXON_ID=230516 /ORGANISM="Chaetoceros curvisetus" /LENGTH=120 /DNA_ID=CAMNT_0051636503 /DNA_START=28 /DNA_END=390 /DNA_ORIENTATION=+
MPRNIGRKRSFPLVNPHSRTSLKSENDCFSSNSTSSQESLQPPEYHSDFSTGTVTPIIPSDRYSERLPTSSFLSPRGPITDTSLPEFPDLENPSGYTQRRYTLGLRVRPKVFNNEPPSLF